MNAAAPMPEIAPPGVTLNGHPVPGFEGLGRDRVEPHGLSHRLKLGLLLPATNTSMEFELWQLLMANTRHGLDGIGVHTTSVATPAPRFGNATELAAYREQFLGGLRVAVSHALLAQPQRLVMGMSLEHIIHGLENIERTMAEVRSMSDLPWTTWHQAALAALQRVEVHGVRPHGDRQLRRDAPPGTRPGPGLRPDDPHLHRRPAVSPATIPRGAGPHAPVRRRVVHHARADRRAVRAPGPASPGQVVCIPK